MITITTGVIFFPEFYNTGVNFINILRKPFSYKSVLRSFSLVTVWLCNVLVGKDY